MPWFRQKIYLSILIAGICGFPLKTSAGVIQGHVVNGSKDSSAVSGLFVELLRFDPARRMPEAVEEQPAMQNGRFVFTVSLRDTTIRYYASSEYQGVRYFSQPLLSEGENFLVVYDSTHSADSLHTVMHHLIIDQGRDALFMRENRIIRNPLDYTVVNAFPETPAGMATFVYPLPLSSFNFTPSENSDAKMAALNNRVYDMGVFLPGTRQISYSYFVPWNRNDKTLVLKPGLPTRAYEVFINNPDIGVISEQLQFIGPFNIRGIPYLRFKAQHLERDGRIVLQLHMPSRGPSNTMIIVLFGGILIVTYLVSIIKSPDRPSEHPDLKKLKDEKQKLLHALSRLDPDSDRFKQRFRRLEDIEIMHQNLQQKS
jgi:hypothetical protein